MKRYLRDYAVLALFAGGIIALDQWTKYLVQANLELGEMWVPWEWLAPYARIVHWSNTGVAFGMFQGWGSAFSILNLIVAAVIVFYYPRVPRQEWPLKVAMGMQLAGAIGNLIDRLTLGHVVDFISVGTFPVWNIADASITLGVAVLIVGVYFQEKREKAAAALAAEAEAGPQVSETDLPAEQEKPL